MTQTNITTPVLTQQSTSQRRRTVTVYISLPLKREGLSRGIVLVQRSNTVTFDFFYVRYNSEDIAPVLLKAIQAVLRHIPADVVNLQLSGKGFTRAEYDKITKELIDLAKNNELTIQHSNFGNSREVLRFIANYINERGQWDDMNNGLHSYVYALGNGDQTFVSVVNVSARRVIFRQMKEAVSDPVAAGVRGIKQAISGVGGGSGVAVWSNTPSLNDVLKRRKGVMLSEEAIADLKVMTQVRKDQEIEVVALPTPHLLIQELCHYLCTQSIMADLNNLSKKGSGETGV